VSESRKLMVFVSSTYTDLILERQQPLVFCIQTLAQNFKFLAWLPMRRLLGLGTDEVILQKKGSDFMLYLKRTGQDRPKVPKDE
jgi:hypothetical protein